MVAGRLVFSREMPEAQPGPKLVMTIHTVGHAGSTKATACFGTFRETRQGTISELEAFQRVQRFFSNDQKTREEIKQ